ncbi:MAG: RagB/SusD family nutrient uptake outer membrane protein, partial [Bacteroidales bacterium]|nr:RagB/SusD family nutrient uptake outer membrane protein [Bacteroidales bacterium]
MKKIFNSIIATVVAITLSGCWGLDYIPHDAIGEQNFLDRASDVTKLMAGTYGQLKEAWAFGYDFLFDSVTDIATGDYFQNYAMGISAYTDGWISGHWQQTYNVVQTANTTIRMLQNVEVGTQAGEITAAMRDQGIAEAKFLRALGYFRLICLFGDIPYYDEEWDLPSHFNN